MCIGRGGTERIHNFFGAEWPLALIIGTNRRSMLDQGGIST
jgi:hypothetical protein